MLLAVIKFNIGIAFSDGPDLPLTDTLVQFYEDKHKTFNGKKSLCERIRKGFTRAVSSPEPKYGYAVYRHFHGLARAWELRYTSQKVSFY